MDWINFLFTIVASTIFAAGGAYAGIKYALMQNVKDHSRYEKDIDSLQQRMSAAEQSVVKAITLIDEWSDSLKEIDHKLKSVCADLAFLRGKYSGESVTR